MGNFLTSIKTNKKESSKANTEINRPNKLLKNNKKSFLNIEKVKNKMSVVLNPTVKHTASVILYNMHKFLALTT
jgi:hypothetical protein